MGALKSKRFSAVDSLEISHDDYILEMHQFPRKPTLGYEYLAILRSPYQVNEHLERALGGLWCFSIKAGGRLGPVCLCPSYVLRDGDCTLPCAFHGCLWSDEVQELMKMLGAILCGPQLA